MNGFWIAGITINLIAVVVVLGWAVRAWKQTDAAQRRPEGQAQGEEPDT